MIAHLDFHRRRLGELQAPFAPLRRRRAARSYGSDYESYGSDYQSYGSDYESYGSDYQSYGSDHQSTAG
jgi:hypothetical protein